jgi:molybdopterin/thiamine biosynthesis adenylyltransferase
MEENFRFKGFNWFGEMRKVSVTIGGVGGIGSYVAFLLARAEALSLDLWDMDRVETHNLGCQLFFKNSLNDLKTKSCIAFISETTNRRTDIYLRGEITPETNKDDIGDFVFSCFDNFKARKILFNLWKYKLLNNPFSKNFIFIDGRLDGELLQIYCVTRDNYELYESTLNENNLVTIGTHCTMQQTSHVGAMIGSSMVSFFTNHLSNLVDDIDAREVPYFFEKFLPLAQETIITKAESIERVKALKEEQEIPEVETNSLPFNHGRN